MTVAVVLAPLVTGCGRSAGGDDAVPAKTSETNTDNVAVATPAATSESTAEPDTATDAGGATPQRIVSLSPTATEMLFAVGAGEQVVAVDEFSNYPPEAPVTDLSGWQPNVEAISGYEPDLVVSESPIDGIVAIGAENLVLEAPKNIEGSYTQIEQLGLLTGHPEEAADVVASMRSSIEAAVDRTADLETKTYYHELGTELYTATSNTFIGSVYGLFNLDNIADAADSDGSAAGYPQLTEEYIIDADPDLIFLADTIGYAQTPETVAERPGWDQLSAVKDGHVIELNDDIASRWGPRLPEFVETVAKAVENAQ